MKYKLVTMSRLIEKTSFLEDLKEFDITKNEVTMKGYLGKDWTYNEFYIDIKTIEQLEKIQKITECPITLYRGTLEIEDGGYSACNNTDGDCFCEDFKTEEEAIKYLNNEDFNLMENNNAKTQV